MHMADSCENEGRFRSDNMNVFSVSTGKTNLSVQVKRCNFRLPVSPGNAEAIVK